MDVRKRMVVVGALLLIVMAPTSFFSSPVSAEELRHPYPVRGYVYDSTGNPVPEGVTVYITDVTKNVTISTETNESGFYCKEIYCNIPNAEDGDLFVCSATYNYESGSCSFILNRSTNLSQRCDIYLQRETTPPEITNLQPPDGSYIRNLRPTISANYSDPSGINLTSVIIKVDDIDVTENASVRETGVLYTTDTDLVEGVHCVTVNVSDNAGNENSKTWCFTVDVTPPDTSIISGPSGTIDYDTVTFEWTGSDNIAATENLQYSYRLDDGDWSGWTYSTSVTFSNLPSGTHTFEVKAKDLAGNEDPTPAERTFTVSRPAPRRAPGGARVAPLVAAGETSLPTTAEGEVTTTTTAKSADGRAAVTIPAGIKATIGGAPITKITIKPPSVLPATPPPNVEYKGYAYDFGPSGATFSEPVEISITFDPADFKGLTPVIYMYDETAKEWKRLDTTIVGNKAIAKVTHFTTFVLFGEKVPLLTPTPTPSPTPTPPVSPVAPTTPTPTPTPSPSPTPPGFEAIFAVAGLLAIAYLVLRRRK